MSRRVLWHSSCVTDASLLGAGQIRMIGPNGADKTTLMPSCLGAVPDRQPGTIGLNGRPARADVPSDQICHHGLARSFQITNLFQGCRSTKICGYPCERRAGTLQRLARYRSLCRRACETAELIKFLGLEGIEQIEERRVVGGQRLVPISASRLAPNRRCCCSTRQLAGLAAAERERVSDLVKNIAANIPVLIVEHDIDNVLGFSHTVTVMVRAGAADDRPARRQSRADRRVREICGTGIPEVVHDRTDEAEARRRAKSCVSIT